MNNATAGNTVAAGRPTDDSAPPLAATYCIRALLPDDGTDRRLLAALLQQHGITRVDSVAVRSVGALHAAHTRSGRLPEAEMARLVTVLVEDAAADALFDFVCEKGAIDRLGGGSVTLQRLRGATPYALPAGVAVEQA